MQSGFDPPPPPGGNPPPDPFAPPTQPQQQQAQAQPAYPQNPYPQQPYPQNPYPPNPYPQNAYGPQFIQPAPGYVQNYGGYGYAAPTDGKATASLVLGIISVMCFIPFTGIAAIIFGFLARRDINRSGGALGGGGLAIGGIVIGSLGTLLLAIYAVAMGVAMMSASHMASGIPTGYPTSPFVLPPPTALPTATATGAVASTVMHGTIKVVSLGGGRPLQDQLSELRTSEIATGRTVIVQTTAAWCAACKEIDSTIDDPLLQKALANVTLVEVDTDEFGAELGALKMETDAIPYFFKIDSAARATDAISGDEWDENTPANEAPVLGAFVKGTLKKRRHPNPVGTSL
jgi:thiol-disulfide isomerase/thioredoxin